MSNPGPEQAWSLADEAEDDFVLEDDETFGAGELVEAELPPFENADEPPAAAATSYPLPDDADDGFSLTDTAPPPMPSSLPLDSHSTEQPVPRITIHACCDRPDVADLISGIIADRRMARAEISVEHGGLEAAITRFAAQASPNLLIIDSMMQGPVMLHHLDRLAEVMEEGTKVIIIGAVNSRCG